MFEIRLNNKLIRRYHDRKKAELNFTICEDLIYKGYDITIHHTEDKPEKGFNIARHMNKCKAKARIDAHCPLCKEYAPNTDGYCSYCGQRLGVAK